MDYKEAFETLEIDYIHMKMEDLTEQYITKRYRRMALLYHPDKNGNTFASTERFKKINESYRYLKEEFVDCHTVEDDACVNPLYLNVVKEFITSVSDGTYIDSIIKIVTELFLSKSHLSFDELDKDTSLHIYLFLSKYKSILWLNDDLLDMVKKIVLQKYSNVVIYKLNPTINDIINNNVYKLCIEDKQYMIPLWHSETYFEENGRELIAICEPDLPSNMTIDDNNNVVVNVYIDNIQQLIKNKAPLLVYVGDKCFPISLDNLNMKREQFYYLKEKGIAKARNDIFDISEKTDIIVKIIIT
jgi:hypothetical protein